MLVGIRKGQCGSVTFIQRLGSALNLTPHFHTLVLDGVYAGPSHSPGDADAREDPGFDFDQSPAEDATMNDES